MTRKLKIILVSLGLLLAACNPTVALGVEPMADSKTTDQVITQLASGSNCPTTQPPDPPFVPPAPWPPQPPGEGQIWVGDAGLWTALPANGSWQQLAFGEKFWWWSEEFDVSEDSTPDIAVSARRLDGDAPPFYETNATNGYHESFNWAMLVGVSLASSGCWEITAEYKGHNLTLVIWVPEH